MDLSMAVGFPLIPSSERKVLEHSRTLEVVVPKVGWMGAEEAERKRTCLRFYKSGFHVLRLHSAGATHGLQRGSLQVNDGGHYSEPVKYNSWNKGFLPQYKLTR